MPSPIMATARPRPTSWRTRSSFCSGRSSAWRFSMPASRASTSAARRRSPVEHLLPGDAKAGELGGGFADSGAQAVAKQDGAGEALVLGDQNGGGAQGVGFGEGALKAGDAVLNEEGGAADADGAGVERSLSSPPRHDLGVIRLGERGCPGGRPPRRSRGRGRAWSHARRRRPMPGRGPRCDRMAEYEHLEAAFGDGARFCRRGPYRCARRVRARHRRAPECLGARGRRWPPPWRWG